MSKLSLRQVAEWAGTTKPTVLKHIQASKVSGERDEEGRWWFDVSEVRRAYGEPKSQTGSGTGSENTALYDPTHLPLQPETGGNGLLMELRRQIEELREDKADLRRRLDEREEVARENERRLLGVIEKQAEQVKLLTDQRPKEPEPAPKPKGVWGWLTGT